MAWSHVVVSATFGWSLSEASPATLPLAAVRESGAVKR